MPTVRSLTRAAAAGAAVALTAFGAAAQAGAAPAGAAPATFTPADVAFMTGMIQHHTQALIMAGWAPSHGASAQVQTLCARIIVAQTDEIATMQRWLQDNKQPAADLHADSAESLHGMAGMAGMPGMDHAMMPGMLTPSQMGQLGAARGTQFDSLFLTYMIQHHQGAITMVDQLFATPGAFQDEVLYKIASDISADQTAEIDRMRKMLAALPPGGTSK